MEKEICSKKMSFEDCELAILRHAIEIQESNKKIDQITEEVNTIISILKNFMVEKKVICYGGTAINNILPKEAQFYTENEIPDYDFFSKTPLNDAKLLANLYYKKGFKEVEAKAGSHTGTFKVFVNFIPIADITYLEKPLFDSIFSDTIVIEGIHYAPPNYLRMSMFLELSRPKGQIDRWEKVFNRLKLLNEYFPFSPNESCFKQKPPLQEIKEKVFVDLFHLLLTYNVVFVGGFAFRLCKDQSQKSEFKTMKYPLFDVLSDEYEKISVFIVRLFKEKNIEATTIKNKCVGEIIPEHIDILVNGQAIVSIYNPIACYSYNEIVLNQKDLWFKDDSIVNQPIKIATTHTILSFYLAFLYTSSDKNIPADKYNKDRILCMSEVLYTIQQKRATQQNGIFKQFSLDCYGKQKTQIDLRMERTEKRKELKKGTKEYDWFFLNYRPEKSAFEQEVKTIKKHRHHRKKYYRKTKKFPFLIKKSKKNQYLF